MLNLGWLVYRRTQSCQFLLHVKDLFRNVTNSRTIIVLCFCSDTKFLGMAARMSNKYFLYDLVLMLDILQEISLLSNALQARGVSLPMAGKKSKGQLKHLKCSRKVQDSMKKKLM